MYIQEEKKPIARSIFNKTLFLFTGLVFGFFLSRIFFQTFTIADDSMLPNLKKGDRAVIFKSITPKIGDIILFRSPLERDKVMVKRIIANSGDVVEIKDKLYYVNSSEFKFQRPVLSRDRRIFPENFSNRDNLPAKKINNRECFVTGDNLDYSFDSRDFGPVSEKNIIGKVIFIY
jgi:signal peptidase I